MQLGNYISYSLKEDYILIQVSPPYDPAQVTSLLAARVIFDAMGF